MCVDTPTATTEVNIRDSKLDETAPYMTVSLSDQRSLVEMARRS